MWLLFLQEESNIKSAKAIKNKCWIDFMPGFLIDKVNVRNVACTSKNQAYWILYLWEVTLKLFSAAAVRSGGLVKTKVR